jgi:Rrf2 family protein
MKLTRASSYALHAVTYMALQKENPLSPADVIAKVQGIPVKFLPRLLKPLVSARVLQSRKGPGGGYRLARPASKITVLEVVEAVDGPVRGQVPFADVKRNGNLDKRLQVICDQSADRVRRLLQTVTISDLIARGAR